MKYVICCLSGVVKMGRDLLNNTQNTYISNVKYSLTITLYFQTWEQARSYYIPSFPEKTHPRPAAAVHSCPRDLLRKMVSLVCPTKLEAGRRIEIMGQKSHRAQSTGRVGESLLI